MYIKAGIVGIVHSMQTTESSNKHYNSTSQLHQSGTYIMVGGALC